MMAHSDSMRRRRRLSSQWQPQPTHFKLRIFRCTFPGCKKRLRSVSGRTRHVRLVHCPSFAPAPGRIHNGPESSPVISIQALRSRSPERSADNHPDTYDFEQDLSMLTADLSMLSISREELQHNADFHLSGETSEDSTTSSAAASDDADIGEIIETDDALLVYHRYMNGELQLHSISIVISNDIRHSAVPCNEAGDFLEAQSPPIPKEGPSSDDWFPYQCRADFELADFLYREEQMSASHITKLLQIIKAYQSMGSSREDYSRTESGGASYGTEYDNDTDDSGARSALFNGDAQRMYNVIDATKVGDIAWETFSNFYKDENGERVTDDSEDSWKLKEYDVWYRDPFDLIQNLMDNPTLDGAFDYVPFREFWAKDNSESTSDIDGSRERVFGNYMSGNFAWDQAVSIYRHFYDEHIVLTNIG